MFGAGGSRPGRKWHPTAENSQAQRERRRPPALTSRLQLPRRPVGCSRARPKPVPAGARGLQPRHAAGPWPQFEIRAAPPRPPPPPAASLSRPRGRARAPWQPEPPVGGAWGRESPGAMATAPPIAVPTGGCMVWRQPIATAVSLQAWLPGRARLSESRRGRKRVPLWALTIKWRAGGGGANRGVQPRLPP